MKSFRWGVACSRMAPRSPPTTLLELVFVLKCLGHRQSLVLAELQKAMAMPTAWPGRETATKRAVPSTVATKVDVEVSQNYHTCNACCFRSS